MNKLLKRIGYSQKYEENLAMVWSRFCFSFFSFFISDMARRHDLYANNTLGGCRPRDLLDVWLS
jgi:hypothetical protein